MPQPAARSSHTYTTAAQMAALPSMPGYGSAWMRVVGPPLGLALLGLVGLLALDLPLARWSHSTRPPGVLQELYDVAEAFGNGIGILLVAWAIVEFDRPRRWAVGRVLLFGLGAGLTANGLKLLIERARPRNFDLSLDSAFLSFGEWFPFLGEPSGNQSFPSAHTATAVGLAVALCTVYPQARRLSWVLVAIVGLARIGGTAHYFSDVCAGAAVGWLFCAAWLQIPLLHPHVARVEAYIGHWLGGRPETPALRIYPEFERRAA